MDFKQAWDDLHQLPQFRPVYPDDRMVAWSFRNLPRRDGRVREVLDIGCGAGRHALFYAREGYRASACDFSAVGVEETKRRAKEAGLEVATKVCEADALAYPDESFDAALVFGTYTYLPLPRFEKAVAELHRVLRPGGKAMVVTRSTEDDRVADAELIGPSTWRITRASEGAPSTVEIGMVMTFLERPDITRIFSAFSRVLVDRHVFTYGGGAFSNVDWHIHAEK